MSVKQELKFQAPTPAPPFNFFGSGSNHLNLLGLRPQLHSPGWKIVSIAANHISWQC